MAEPEVMPKLNLSREVLLSSPLEGSPSSTMSLFQLGIDDGLSSDDAITCNPADRDDRHEFVKSAVNLLQKIPSEDVSRKVFDFLILLSEYDDSALLISQHVPALAQATCAASAAKFASMKTLLTRLCCQNDSAVIGEITEGLRQLFFVLEEDSIATTLIPLVSFLASSRWSSPRSVGTALLVELARRVDTEAAQEPFRARFLELCRDDSVQVQRAACRNVAQWSSVMGMNQLSQFLLPIIHEFVAAERHDTIQIELVPQLVQVAQYVGRHMTSKYLHHLYHALCRHASWRVRYTAASNVSAFAVLLHRPDDIADEVVLLAKDPEPNTVATTLRQLHLICASWMRATVETHLLPLLSSWVHASDPLVRSAIAATIFVFLVKCPMNTVDLIAMLRELLADPDMSVNCALIGSLSLFSESSGNATISEFIVDAVKLAAQSPKWRLRGLAAEQLRHVCSTLPAASFASLEPVLLALLEDPVAFVRTSAVTTLEVVSRHFGPQWSAGMCYRLLSDHHASAGTALGTRSSSSLARKSYQTREVIVHCCRTLLPIANGIHASSALWKQVEDAASRLLLEFSVDPVPNVRIAVGRVVLVLKSCDCAIAREAVHRVHSHLLRDADPDVVRAASTMVDEPF